MSVERSLEAWEEVQRHGQDLADRLAQGFTGLLQSHNIVAPPPFSWTPPSKSPFFDHLEFPSSYAKRWDHLPSLVAETSGFSGGVSAIFDIGNRIGQAGAEVGACVGGVVQQFVRHVPLPFWKEDGLGSAVVLDLESRRKGEALEKYRDEVGSTRESFGERGLLETMGGLDESGEDGGFAFDLKSSGQFGRPQGSINVTTTYDSRIRDIESSIVARGDLWRVEASRGGANSGPERTPLFLLQLGPILFVRDTTLLLPVHLSKQHLLWYGYDRKNGVHSLCPALWSKHRRWLLMSMICLNPLACSFLDVQFPNGQLTYVAGEGFTTSAFLPAFGGLLQAQGQYPGETKFSFSCKNKWGTRITPTVQWPDRSFSLGVSQALAWKRSGLIVRPTLQLSICPTFGGSNPGLRAEVVHSVQEQLNFICGYAFTTHPSAYASVSIGRSKWNGNVGTSGLVVRVETPLSTVGRPSFSVQLNSGVEF